jgi:hypothetical protein
MELRPASEALEILQKAIPGAKIFRISGDSTHAVEGWTSGKLTLRQPQYFYTEENSEYSLTMPGGKLFAEVGHGSRDVWILSDPDLMSNSGIDDDDNGVVAVSIIRKALPPGGKVIIDETSHGFEQRPNLLRVLLHPPFIAVGIAGIVTLIVLAWAGIARFGAPRPETAGLAAGKLTLVRNAAQLLRLGTTASNLMLSYRRLVLADAIAELHGPPGLDEFAQAAWLDRAAVHRGLTIRVKPLLDEMSSLAEADRLDAARALRFSLDLHRWKQEILNGTVTPRRR